MKLVHGTPFTIINSAGTDLNLDSFAETRPVLIDPILYGMTIGRRDSSQSQLLRSAFRASTLADFGCTERDWTQPYASSDEVEAAWLLLAMSAKVSVRPVDGW